MSSVLGSKEQEQPYYSPQKSPEVITQIDAVTDSAADVKKKRLLPTGRSSALLAGISNALKKRFGE